MCANPHPLFPINIYLLQREREKVYVCLSKESCVERCELHHITSLVLLERSEFEGKEEKK